MPYNRRRKHRIKTQFANFAGIFIFLLLTVNPSAGLAQSQSTDQLRNQLQDELNQITALQTRINKVESDLNKIDQDLIHLRAPEGNSWYSHRRAVKLKSKKATVSEQLSDLVIQQRAHKESAAAISHNFYSRISTRIDSLIEAIHPNETAAARKQQMTQLLELKSQRDWLVESQYLYSDYPVPEGIADDQVFAFLRKSKNNATLRNEFQELIGEKIDQVNMIIAAAREESTLRHRLAQFSNEMSAISGEIDLRSATTTGPIATGWDGATDQETYSNGNIDIARREKNADQSIPATVTQTDFLFLFYNLTTDDMNTYISQLDSIRRSYVKLLTELQ